VVDLAPFGAFVSIGAYRGLLHKSEMAHGHVENPASIVKVGDELDVKVLKVEAQHGRTRISLSRKALLPQPPSAPSATAESGSQGSETVTEGTHAASRDGRRHERGVPSEAKTSHTGAAFRRRNGQAAGKSQDQRTATPTEEAGHERPPQAKERRHRREERSLPRGLDAETETKLARLGEILLAKLGGQLPEK